MKTSFQAIFRMTTALLMLCIPLESISQTPALIWAKKANNATDDIYCYDIAIDPTGYVYTVGYFGGTVDFDPGAATSNITATGGGNSAFIQKLDTNGNFVWARAIHSSTSNLIGPYAVSLDAVGNVYVSGYFLGTADFNPGAATANLTALAPWDAFVLKLNTGGNYVWAKQFGNAGAIMWTDDNVVDAANNVYTAGGFDGTVDFNPGAAVLNMTSSGYDSYVQKMDAAGNFLWAKKNTSTGSEIAHSISVDNSSNVVVGGYFSGPVLDLDPNAGVSNFSLLGVQDLFIQKLSSAGNLVWAGTLGGPGVYMFGITEADPLTGDFVTAGIFDGTVDFNPGAGVSNLTGVNNADGFVQKMNSANVFQWVKYFQCNDYLDFTGITYDNTGNIYCAGTYLGTVDFDPGAGVVSRTAPDYCTFIFKLSSAGNLVWLATADGNADTNIEGVRLDVNKNVYGTGWFNGTTDFDPQATVVNQSTSGLYGQFVYKLRQVSGVLPLLNLELHATGHHSLTELNWNTNADAIHFDIERSADAVNFISVGQLKPIGSESQFQFIDQGVASGATYWYRIQMRDENGNAFTSETVEVTIPESESGLLVFPNPASQFIQLFSERGIGKVSVSNSMGQIVMWVDGNGQTEFTIDIEALPAGIYFVKVENEVRFVTVVVE